VLDVWERAVRDSLMAQIGCATQPMLGAVQPALHTLPGARLQTMLLALQNVHRAMDGNGIYTVVMDNLLIEFAGGIA
jgi:hypothetical protein